MIEFKNITKKYKGTIALDNISLCIPDNGIYCLLGRNGAGKTTFMKLLAGHISATNGIVSVNSKKVSTSKMPTDVNYFESGSEQFNMRVGDLIETAAELQDDFNVDFAKRMVAKFRLNSNKRFKSLSFGMKTMLSSIQLLANNAKVVLLDEPTLGFDALMRERFNELLIESYEANPRVIIISTHLIDEIAKVVERLIIIEEGKILIETGIDEIDEKAYSLSGQIRDIEPLLEGLNCIGKKKSGAGMVAYVYDNRITVPNSVHIERLGLQDFFVNIIGGNQNG